jgi:cell division protein FtsL
MKDLIEQLEKKEDIQSLVTHNLRLNKKVKSLEKKVSEQNKEMRLQKQKVTFLTEQMKLLQL